LAFPESACRLLSEVRKEIVGLLRLSQYAIPRIPDWKPGVTGTGPLSDHFPHSSARRGRALLTRPQARPLPSHYA